MNALEVIVFLASHEYGNDIMLQVAREQFQCHKDKENLRITVYEQGGWYLSYGFIDGEVMVVASANDRAIFSPSVDSYWKRLMGAKWGMSVVRRKEVA